MGSTTAHGAAPRVHPLSIVLCDDHRVFVESLELALTARGHSVVGVGDPAKAAEVATSRRADVCVMDLSFGRSDSLEGIRLLADSGFRVVVLTGYLDDLVRHQCLEAGAAYCVGKDWPLDDVLTAIEGLPRTFSRSRASGRHAVGPDQWSAHPTARFLTARERQVLVALVVGETTESVAKRLEISPATVRTHIQTMLAKLGVHTRLEAVSFAVRNSLVAPPQERRRDVAM